jgi:predicted nucleic acid-binding protein
MIVVVDTSPLNSLIRLGHPDILHEIYGRVLVPHAVLIEMQHPEAP